MFVAVIFASLAVTFLNTIVPMIIGFTVDSIIGAEPVPENYAGIVQAFGGVDRLKADIWIVAVLIVSIAACSFVFHYLRIYLTNRANQTLVRRMRNTLFSHIQRLPLLWQTEHRTGDTIQRCTSDVDTISNFITNQLLQLFRIGLLLILSVWFMFAIDVKLAAIATAFVPLLVGYSLLFYFKAGPRFKKCDEEEGVLSSIAQENLTGVRVVKAFGKERYERDRFDRQNTYYTGLWVRLEKFMAAYWTSSDFIAAAQLLVVVVVGTVMCVGGTMTAGDLVAFISYNTMMIGPVRMLGRIISNLSKSGVALGRLSEIMNAEEEDYGEVSDVAVSGDIVFDNVCFEYEEGKPVLNNVSFRVPQGSTLGIIGGTGSGKSSIGYVLDRLYPIKSGSVTIGGRDINDISLADIRKNIGLILQESYIYSRTVADNISIASDRKDIDSVKEAAATSCLDENIEGFTDGYDTTVGERGVTLSGGQRQRMAIARTLMRDVPYIIFDDSLSAVDSDTDIRIRKNLKERGNATKIIISHRITTVMNADNIIVLDGGRIVESGTNDELLERGGIYKRIYDMQMSLPEELKVEVNNG